LQIRPPEGGTTNAFSSLSAASQFDLKALADNPANRIDKIDIVPRAMQNAREAERITAKNSEV
jgi:hypothetical protein